MDSRCTKTRRSLITEDLAEGQGLQSGMVFAIEPMICQGAYDVETLSNDWTVVTLDGKLAAHYENTVVITDGEPQLLTLVE